LELFSWGVDRFSGIQKHSLLVGMFAHFTNNSIAVAALFLSMKMTEYAEKMGISNVSEMNTSGAADVFGELQASCSQLLAVIIFYLFMFVFMAVVLGSSLCFY